MRNLMFFAILFLPLAAGGCNTGPSKAQLRRSAATILERQKTVAQPGIVAATDLAFARMAQDDGLWTAWRFYAAPGALMPGENGVAPVINVLADRADPPEPIRWAPRQVWSSCDGTLAASVGRFARPNGIVGDYVTIWQLQRDGTYRWVYGDSVPDEKQPAPTVTPDNPDPDTIVVTEINAIKGHTADCPRGGEPLPAPPSYTGQDAQFGQGISNDRTLQYRWEYHPDGSPYVAIEWLREGAWREAFKLPVTPG